MSLGFYEAWDLADGTAAASSADSSKPVLEAQEAEQRKPLKKDKRKRTGLPQPHVEVTVQPNASDTEASESEETKRKTLKRQRYQLAWKQVKPEEPVVKPEEPVAEDQSIGVAELQAEPPETVNESELDRLLREALKNYHKDNPEAALEPEEQPAEELQQAAQPVPEQQPAEEPPQPAQQVLEPQPAEEPQQAAQQVAERPPAKEPQEAAQQVPEQHQRPWRQVAPASVSGSRPKQLDGSMAPPEPFFPPKKLAVNGPPPMQEPLVFQPPPINTTATSSKAGLYTNKPGASPMCGAFVQPWPASSPPPKEPPRNPPARVTGPAGTQHEGRFYVTWIEFVFFQRFNLSVAICFFGGWNSKEWLVGLMFEHDIILSCQLEQTFGIEMQSKPPT